MIKYTTSPWRNQIEEIDVIKETEKSFTQRIYDKDWHGNNRITDRLRMKSSTPLFDTWEDAKQSIVSRLEKQVEDARMNLERKKGELGQVKGMKHQ